MTTRITMGTTPANREGVEVYKNQVILEGFLGKKPELRDMPSGDRVANVSMATKELWNDKSGKTVSATEWHSLVFYGERADRASMYGKGDNIHVEGKLQTRRFTDANGNPKTVREVVVMRSHRIDRMHDDGSGNDLGQEPPQHSEEAGPVRAGHSDNWPL